MYRKFLYRLIMAVICLVNMCDLIRAESEPPQSYLSASELLDLYASMYSSIHNMSVSYTDVVEDIILDPNKPHAYDHLVRYQKVLERTEEGDKYYMRYFSSTEPNAVVQPDQILEYAYDGSVSMEYCPENKMGTIVPEKMGRKSEGYNDLLRYMLLTHQDFPIGSRFHELYPHGAPVIQLLVSPQGTVRPHLEQIGSEWCHVVDTPYLRAPQEINYGTIIWFAAEKGGLPMKFERYNRGKHLFSFTVQKVATANTETGPVWYPQEATLNNRGMKHRFVCHELRVNIETHEDTWRLSFPVGTRVVDYVQCIDYIVGTEGESIMVGTLYHCEKTESPPPSGGTKDSETPLGDGQDVSQPSTDPNQAEARMLFIEGAIVIGGKPIPDVNVVVNNGGQSDITDSQGRFCVTVPYGWSGTLTPLKEGITFNPSCKKYHNVREDISELAP